MDFQYKNFKNDSNALLHSVHLTILRTQADRLERGIPFPEVFYLQLDNVATNKNHHLIAYASYLIMSGIFKKVKIGFLIAGHTHENIDQMFSRLSIRLRRKECLTVTELIKVAEECFTPSPKCMITTEIADIANWLDGHDYSYIQNKMRNLEFSHQFKIYGDADGKVRVQCKQFSTDEKWEPDIGVEVLKGLPATDRPHKLQRIGLVPHTTRSRRQREKEDSKEKRRKEREAVEGNGLPRPSRRSQTTGHRRTETEEDKVARQTKDHEEALANLRKTVDMIASKHMSAWTPSRRTWWDTFFTEQEGIMASDLVLDWESTPAWTWKQLQKYSEQSRSPDDDNAVVSQVIRDRVNPEIRPIQGGTGRTLPSLYNRRCDLREVQVGQLVCLEAPETEPPNADRPQDVSTPFWIGKILSLDEPTDTFKVSWYGAERGVMRKPVPLWTLLRFQPRYNKTSDGSRGNVSQPKTSLLKRTEMGLIAFDFTLKAQNPTDGLKQHTWRLINEAMQSKIPREFYDNVTPPRLTSARPPPGVGAPTPGAGPSNVCAGPSNVEERPPPRRGRPPVAHPAPAAAAQGGANEESEQVLNVQQQASGAGNSAALTMNSDMDGEVCSSAISGVTQVEHDNDGNPLGTAASFIPAGREAVAQMIRRPVSRPEQREDDGGAGEQVTGRRAGKEPMIEPSYLDRPRTPTPTAEIFGDAVGTQFSGRKMPALPCVVCRELIGLSAKTDSGNVTSQHVCPGCKHPVHAICLPDGAELGDGERALTCCADVHPITVPSNTPAEREIIPYARKDKLKSYVRARERETQGSSWAMKKLREKAKVQAFLARMKEHTHAALLSGSGNVGPPGINPTQTSTLRAAIDNYETQTPSLMESGCSDEVRMQLKRRRGVDADGSEDEQSDVNNYSSGAEDYGYSSEYANTSSGSSGEHGD